MVAQIATLIIAQKLLKQLKSIEMMNTVDIPLKLSPPLCYEHYITVLEKYCLVQAI